jgi:hypothetical protein
MIFTAKNKTTDGMGGEEINLNSIAETETTSTHEGTHSDATNEGYQDSPNTHPPHTHTLSLSLS